MAHQSGNPAGNDRAPRRLSSAAIGAGFSLAPPKNQGRARLRRLARQVHLLGERPLYELFLELDCGADLRDALERYAALAPRAGFIQANDGDQIRPQLWSVQ
jgi:hypothetical protein